MNKLASVEDAEAPPALPLRQTKSTAILVIHGIGEQNPYETLDQFARGLARHFTKKTRKTDREEDEVNTLTLRPERINHGNWTEVALHMDFARPATDSGLQHIGLFEFYWAPYTEGKVRTTAVVQWLMRTAFTPLRYLGDNLQVLLETHASETKAKKALLAFGLFAREAGRAVLLYIPVLLALAALTAAVSLEKDVTWPKLAQLRAIQGGLSLSELVLEVVCLALVAVYGLLIVHELWTWRRARTRERVRMGVAQVVWLTLAIIVLSGAAWAGWGILRHRRYDVLAELPGLFTVLGALAVAGLVVFVRYILLAYVGDVTVYVTADQKAPNYQARSAILDSSCDAVARLLRRREYDQVIMAGHSLGSVIAYDTINELLSRSWATSEETTPSTATILSWWDLKRLKGLVTFGSPLDKVYYFFREHLGADQVIRSQILKFLHSFRRGSSGRDYGDFRFTYTPPAGSSTEPFTFPRLGHDFRWLNVYSPMDPVSGKLKFYYLREDDQKLLWYPVWGLAHMMYWEDDKFYHFVADALL